jgi:hypothetical protein
MSFKIIEKDPYNSKKRFKLLIKSAKKRNISVNFSLDHYRDLLKLGCIYCGVNVKKEQGYCIDRHDNSKGYLLDNVATCCKICNRAKGTMDNNDFLDWVKRAYKFQEGMFEKAKKHSYTELQFKKDLKRLENGSYYRNSNVEKIEGNR